MEAITRDAKYDLVLCDVLMPGMNGVEVLTWIRQRFKVRAFPHVVRSRSPGRLPPLPGSDAPWSHHPCDARWFPLTTSTLGFAAHDTRQASEITVIMISSNDTTTMVEQCILHGADSYMLKPASSKEVSALWQFVARRQQQRERVARKANDLLDCIQMIEESVGDEASSDALSQHGATAAPRRVRRASREGGASDSNGGEQGKGAQRGKAGSVARNGQSQLEIDLAADLRAAQLHSLSDLDGQPIGALTTTRIVPALEGDESGGGAGESELQAAPRSRCWRCVPPASRTAAASCRRSLSPLPVP